MVSRITSPRVVLGLALLFMFSGIMLITSHNVRGFAKKKKGWLGVSVQEMTPSLREAMELGDRSGLLITDVVHGSPADDADLREEDVIVKFDGKEVEKANAFARLVRNTEPGTKVKLLIFRDGKEKEVEVILGKRKSKRLRHFGWGGEREIIIMGRPRLGAQVHELNEDLAPYFKVEKNQGVLVLDVTEDSPAEEAGLKAGDVITKVDEEEIRNPEELIQTLEEYEEGDVVQVEYVRGGKKERVEVELEDFEGCGFRFRFPKRFHFRLHRFGIDDFDEAEILIPAMPELPERPAMPLLPRQQEI